MCLVVISTGLIYPRARYFFYFYHHFALTAARRSFKHYFLSLGTMRVLIFTILAVLAAPLSVFACEGQCIISITNAFLGNYTTPINEVLNDIVGTHGSNINACLHHPAQANEINDKLIPKESRTAVPLKYLSALVDAYGKQSYDALERAIFPGYFHGKCQDPKTNIDPVGCPNPDCPVVCGTPGSMVHFYTKLTEIAFKQTQKTLISLTTPGSAVYDKVEAAIREDTGRHHRRANCRKRDQTLDEELQSILRKIPVKMIEACGGHELSRCSWAVAMKRFILSFP